MSPLTVGQTMLPGCLRSEHHGGPALPIHNHMETLKEGDHQLPPHLGTPWMSFLVSGGKRGLREQTSHSGKTYPPLYPNTHTPWPRKIPAVSTQDLCPWSGPTLTSTRTWSASRRKSIALGWNSDLMDYSILCSKKRCEAKPFYKCWILFSFNILWFFLWSLENFIFLPT